MGKEYCRIKDSEAPAKLVKQLITPKESEHWYLRGARIGLLWVTPDIATKGRRAYASARRPSGLLAYFSEYDFLIEISKDAWEELTDPQRRAVIDHELRHCSVRGDSEELKTKSKDGQVEFVWFIRPHDCEVFAEDMTCQSVTPGVEFVKHRIEQLEIDFEANDQGKKVS